MPHEGAVRAWLSRSRVQREDADDMIQETYCQIAGLKQFDHIERPDAYFFSAVRNLLRRRIMRAKVVPLVPISEAGDLEDDARPSTEQMIGGRLDYLRMMTLLDQLPERRRKVVALRKVEGRSQREIAAALDISENIVEHEVRLGLLQLQKAWRDSLQDTADHLPPSAARQGRQT